MDAPKNAPFAVLDSPTSHWPSTARARAFAAMFLMPEDALTDLVRQHGKVDSQLVDSVMQRFGTSITATTWHLFNLRLITADDREDLFAELRDLD